MTHIFTYRVLNESKPEEIATQMKINKKTLRISEHMKLDTRPRWLGKSRMTQSSYRNRAYQYNTLPKELTKNTEVKKF